MKVQFGPGVYRTTYDTIIQAGSEILAGQYTSEVYNNETAVTSISVIGGGAVIVVMNFAGRR